MFAQRVVSGSTFLLPEPLQTIFIVVENPPGKILPIVIFKAILRDDNKTNKFIVSLREICAICCRSSRLVDGSSFSPEKILICSLNQNKMKTLLRNFFIVLFLPFFTLLVEQQLWMWICEKYEILNVFRLRESSTSSSFVNIWFT